MLLLPVLPVLPVQAQPEPRRAEPFGTLAIAAGLAATLNETYLHTLWDPRLGLTGYVATPFYAGTAEVGGTWQHYASRGDVPPFHSVQLYLGWGHALPLASWLAVEAGGRIGNHFMAFDVVTEEAGVRNESELAVGVHGRLRLRMSSRWQLVASARYEHTFTRLPMRFVVASVGIERQLAAPAWWRRLLR